MIDARRGVCLCTCECALHVVAYVSVRVSVRVRVFKSLRAYVHSFVRSCACVVRIVHTHELPQTHARTHIHNSVCKQYWAFSLFSCPWPPPYTGSKLAQREG